MLNSDMPIYEFPLPTRSDYYTICIQKKERRRISTIMTSISKKEEEEIDEIKNGYIRLERGNKVFTITARQIYCYGEVDFLGEKDGGEDLDTIENFNFLNHFEFDGLRVRSGYNYRTHTCKSPKKYPLWTETWSPSFAARLAHASLKKPKRIILFKTEQL